MPLVTAVGREVTVYDKMARKQKRKKTGSNGAETGNSKEVGVYVWDAMVERIRFFLEQQVRSTGDCRTTKTAKRVSGKREKRHGRDEKRRPAPSSGSDNDEKRRNQKWENS